MACSFVIGGDFGASTRHNHHSKFINKLQCAVERQFAAGKFLPWGSRLRETAKPYRPTIKKGAVKKQPIKK